MNLKLTHNRNKPMSQDEITKFIISKWTTLILASLSIWCFFEMIYHLGFVFEDDNLPYITLNDLTGTIYGLLFSGFIFCSIALSLFLISFVFTYWLNATFNQFLWGGGVFLFLLGVILLMSGEASFVSEIELDQMVADMKFIFNLLLGLSTFIMGLTWFIKFKEDIVPNGEIKVKQLNPKFRLFLWITFSWVVTAIPFVLPSCLILLFSDAKRSHILIWAILTLYLCIIPIPIQRYCIIRIGIKYLPRDLYESYLKNNSHQLEKLESIEVTNVTQFFNTIPICNEVYRKKEKLENRNKREFKKLSMIEISTNRLVVNGKVNNSAFSWGIVTKFKKNNLKVFLLSILYFGPIIGLFAGIFPKLFTNASVNAGSFNWYAWNGRYGKLGGLDLFPYNVGRTNSENYLIFAARLQTRNDSLTLIPKNDNSQSSNASDQYEWPAIISDAQKNELQTLMQDMPFLPSIYIYQDNISILMKKYHYNEKDNNELQTWELLKNENSNSDIQFNYLNNAIKIYNIFNNNQY